MLSISSYPRAYVEACRGRIADQMAAYAALPATPAFDGPFFRHMLLALDHYFDHRARGQEGKDGGPLNELRLLCNGVMQDGRMAADKQIRLKTTVTGLTSGDEIVLDAGRFEALAAAVFADIEGKYP